MFPRLLVSLYNERGQTYPRAQSEFDSEIAAQIAAITERISAAAEHRRNSASDLNVYEKPLSPAELFLPPVSAITVALGVEKFTDLNRRPTINAAAVSSIVSAIFHSVARIAAAVATSDVIRSADFVTAIRLVSPLQLTQKLISTVDVASPDKPFAVGLIYRVWTDAHNTPLIAQSALNTLSAFLEALTNEIIGAIVIAATADGGSQSASYFADDIATCIAASLELSALCARTCADRADLFGGQWNNIRRRARDYYSSLLFPCLCKPPASRLCTSCGGIGSRLVRVMEAYGFARFANRIRADAIQCMSVIISACETARARRREARHSMHDDDSSNGADDETYESNLTQLIIATLAIATHVHSDCIDSSHVLYARSMLNSNSANALSTLHNAHFPMLALHQSLHVIMHDTQSAAESASVSQFLVGAFSSLCAYVDPLRLCLTQSLLSVAIQLNIFPLIAIILRSTEPIRLTQRTDQQTTPLTRFAVADWLELFQSAALRGNLICWKTLYDHVDDGDIECAALRTLILHRSYVDALSAHRTALLEYIQTTFVCSFGRACPFIGVSGCLAIHSAEQVALHQTIKDVECIETLPDVLVALIVQYTLIA